MNHLPSASPTPVLARRRFLTLTGGLAAGAVAALAGCGDPNTSATTHTDNRDQDPAAGVPNAGSLHIPPLAESSTSGATRTFNLTAAAGTSSILAAGDTNTWGINGSHLGPTLRVRRGDHVQIHLHNDLDETTTLHWHGMHLPAAADGGPHTPVAPGDTWSPAWTVDQPAATLWYHPHPHGATERHVYRGLAGVLIVDDDAEAALDLPREYGVDDIPLIVQDKTFDAEGQLAEPAQSGSGMLGDTVLVNGTADPTVQVTTQRVRFRLLNGSTARSYNFGFTDNRRFHLIGTDGGLLPAPVGLTRILLTPGERAEIVVTFRPGEDATLHSYPQDLGIAPDTGVDDEFDILHITAARNLRSTPAVPAQLVRIDRLDPALAAAPRAFELGAVDINGQRMDMSRIDEVVTVGEVEVWHVSNTSSNPHNFHIHGVQFQVADVNGEPPPQALRGWKDTMPMPPESSARLVMRFTGHTDPTTPYMYHCHLLWHEDLGMMGQFVVVEPGQRPRLVVDGHEHG